MTDVQICSVGLLELLGKCDMSGLLSLLGCIFMLIQRLFARVFLRAIDACREYRQNNSTVVTIGKASTALTFSTGTSSDIY